MALWDYILPLFGNLFFWVGAIILIFFIIFAILLYFKSKSFDTKCFEIIQLGNGKVNVEVTKAGLVGNKSMLFGLVDFGKVKVMKLKKGRLVRGFNTSDYHSTNKGKKCIIVTSDPADRRFVVPCEKVRISNEEIFFDLPPIELEDACIDAYKQSEKEMKGFNEALIQLFIIGLIVVGALVTIVLVTRFASDTLDNATTVAEGNAQVCADVCTQAVVKGVEKVLSQPTPGVP